MKLHDTSALASNRFTAHSPDGVAVNGVTYRHSIIVTANRVIDDWPVCDAAHLAHDDLATLDEFSTGIVLLGCGTSTRSLPLDVLRYIRRRSTPIDVMDNAAACRTFNILVAEGRTVTAALIIAPPETPGPSS